MRIIKEFLRPEFKVTIFKWNQKYLIKLEQGDLEQTYKIGEPDLTSEQDLNEILSEKFYIHVQDIFAQMGKNFNSHIQLF